MTLATVACVGLAVKDIVFSVMTLPSGPGKTHATRRIELGGGPAANAAVAVAALGGEARFIGAVGDDDAGQWIVADLEARGVSTAGVRVVQAMSSPMSSVVVDRRGERAIVNHTDDGLLTGLRRPGEEDLAGSGSVLADVRWPDGALAALEVARQSGVPGILDYDLGDTNGPQLMRLASHVVFSSDALSRLTGTEDPGLALEQTRDMTDAFLAVTLGSSGVMWFDQGQTSSLPSFPVDVVDTTGAGDVFHGVFALEIARGRGEADSLETASAAAALSCTKMGGRDGVPDRESLEQFLQEMR